MENLAKQIQNTKGAKSQPDVQPKVCLNLTEQQKALTNSKNNHYSYWQLKDEQNQPTANLQRMKIKVV